MPPYPAANTSYHCTQIIRLAPQIMFIILFSIVATIVMIRKELNTHVPILKYFCNYVIRNHFKTNISLYVNLYLSSFSHLPYEGLSKYAYTG